MMRAMPRVSPQWKRMTRRGITPIAFRCRQPPASPVDHTARRAISDILWPWYPRCMSFPLMSRQLSQSLCTLILGIYPGTTRSHLWLIRGLDSGHNPTLCRSMGIKIVLFLFSSSWFNQYKSGVSERSAGYHGIHVVFLIIYFLGGLSPYFYTCEVRENVQRMSQALHRCDNGKSYK